MDMVFNLLLLVIIWCLVSVAALVFFYGNAFRRLWVEPMLSHLVVIFESDDWGVGPVEQVDALDDLLKLFSLYSDQKNHHPVLTLGLVLAEPDINKINSGKNIYYRRDLSDNRYSALVELIKKGQKKKVFSLHLHGMEHYWPDALMSARHNETVIQWFSKTESQLTENLPSYLQSRWCNASSLPSTELEEQDIAKAVEEEKKCFETVFNQKPKVVVPPTFVWTDSVIQQYTSQNINIFITPGRQYTGRDRDGNLLASNRSYYNGEVDQENRAQYLVRDVYFEPQLGHKAERVLMDIKSRMACARPALIEMHRFNFIKDKTLAMDELKHLLDSIKKQLPDVVYLSAEELANAYQSKNELLLHSLAGRLKIWVRRIQLFLQTRRLAKYSGFNLILNSITNT